LETTAEAIESGIEPQRIVPGAANAAERPIAVVELDRFCEGCAYNLRTQAVYRDERTGIPLVRCPECGRHQSANDAATVLRPWLQRVTSLVMGAWILIMIAVLFWLSFAQAAIGYASTEEMTTRSRTQIQQVAGGTTRTVYRRGPREVWTDMPHRGWFIALVLTASGAVAFVSGLLIRVLMPHWRRTACVVVLVAIPSLIWIMAVLIWRDEEPHLLRWGMAHLSTHAAAQVLGGLTAVALGRPFARLLVRIFIPPTLRPRLAYLWMVDGKAFPKPDPVA